MKRLISIFSLLLCFSLIFAGCNTAPENDKESESQYNEDTEEIPSESESEALTDVQIPDVESFEPSRYVNRNFAIKDERAGITLSIPYEWELKAVSAREYSITRDGTTVGKITNRATEESGWEALSYNEHNIDGIDVTRTLEHKMGQFRYRYTYSYTCEEKERLFILTCEHAEISEFTMNKLFVPKKDDFTTDPGFGLLEDGDSYSSILIIGNSFVGTSVVGDMLKNMLHVGGKRCEVTAISIGHAVVSTYTSNTELMKNIWYGNYDAVFMCGLYGDDQIAEAYTLKRYCDNSGTKLIVFPAHNETRSVITKTVQKYSDLTLLDWKGELDALISMGVDRWDLCFDDTYDHSSPVAGYVGAHMIYRSMYGEIPPALRSSVQGYTQGRIDAILGDYTQEGTVQLAERSDVYIFIP